MRRRGRRVVRRRANGRRRLGVGVARPSYVSKKEFEVDEVRRVVVGGQDVDYPTRDAVSFHVRNMGPRFGNMMSAFSRLITTSASTIQAAGIVSSYSEIGTTGVVDYPFTNPTSCPLAIRSHFEVVEICNLNRFPVWLTAQVWKWKPGMNYPGGNLDAEVLRSTSAGGGMFTWDGANQHLVWNGVPIPTNFSNANAFTVESLFGQRKTIYDRQLIKKTWSKRYMIPASGVYKMRVKIPRIWPVFPDNAMALDYLSKNKIDWALALSWHTACGLLPTAAITTDPVSTDIHTEKSILAIRIFRQAVGVRYAYEPAVQVLVRDSGQFTTGVPARTTTNRAEKPKKHMDSEPVSGVPGQT